MAVPRAKSVADLFAECRDRSLVLTPEAALADALNARLDRPHLGHFATTPRRLAARRREGREDRLAFHAAVTTTDLDWTTASHAIGNVLQCWDHTGEARGVLDYDRFDDAAHRMVVDLLVDRPTTSRALAESRIDPAEHPDGVAVIAPDQFTALERSILPDTVREIDPFHDDTADLPPFRVYDTAAGIVDALLHTIDAENADDVAVVLDADGRYAPLVESALEAADVPFTGGPGFADRDHHRAFLQLCRLLHAGDDVRVADARPLFGALDVDLAVEHEAKRLDAVSHLGILWLQQLRSDPTAHAVSEIVDAVDQRTTADLGPLREELAALGVLDAPLTEHVADRLRFYFQRYEVPVDRPREGVLLADASAAYVDRPLVFYLGLDEGWTQRAPRRPWVDPDALYARHRDAFALLLQNGQQQYYLVEDTRGGEPVSPTIYLEDLLDDSFERFTDLDHVPHARSALETGDGFDRDERDVPADTVEAISQSALNSYVNSPRDYLFGDLLDSPDRDYFEEGTWFHDFAEVYATHPDRIGDDAIATVVDAMHEAVWPFLDAPKSACRRTTYRVGCETIARYLDANPPQVPDVAPGWKPFDGNRVADLLGLAADGPHTEVWFRDTDLGMKGSIDLVRSQTELVDYKKGSRSSPRSVVANASIDPPGDAPTYQAPMYLARQRRERPDARLEFTFCHFMETLGEQVTGEEASLDDCESTVTYEPRSFHAHLQRREVYEFLATEHYNDCTDTFSAIDHDAYLAAVTAVAPPAPGNRDDLAGTEFGQTFAERVVAAVADAAADPDAIDAAKGADQALRYFERLDQETLFAPDLDAFEAFVDERIDELNRRLRGAERFPVADLKEEPNERRLDHRDLLLRGDAA
jgi:hypothetical protein